MHQYRTAVGIVGKFQDLAELPLFAKSIARHRQVDEIHSESRRQFPLGDRFGTRQLKVDHCPYLVAMDRLSELRFGQLTAAIEHAALDLVPMIPHQPTLPIQHDQPSSQGQSGQRDQTKKRLAHRADSFTARANGPASGIHSYRR